MSNQILAEGQHFAVIKDVEPLEMSARMHEIGRQLGSTTVEHGLIGFGDPNPMKIHSEIIYHEDLLPYFMLGCVQRATRGGDSILYDAVKAANIIREEEPGLLGVTMVYHAEHYKDTKAVVPLIRNKRGADFLAFRQKKGTLNEVLDLPDGWTEDAFYGYIDRVLQRCVEFDEILDNGDILVVDNYRTLHVRTGFEGLRKMIRVRVDDPEAHKNYVV